MCAHMKYFVQISCYVSISVVSCEYNLWLEVVPIFIARCSYFNMGPTSNNYLRRARFKPELEN